MQPTLFRTANGRGSSPGVVRSLRETGGRIPRGPGPPAAAALRPASARHASRSSLEAHASLPRSPAGQPSTGPHDLDGRLLHRGLRWACRGGVALFRGRRGEGVAAFASPGAAGVRPPGPRGEGVAETSPRRRRSPGAAVFAATAPQVAPRPLLATPMPPRAEGGHAPLPREQRPLRAAGGAATTVGSRERVLDTRQGTNSRAGTSCGAPPIALPSGSDAPQPGYDGSGMGKLLQEPPIAA
jgi:hypothetical protein